MIKMGKIIRRGTVALSAVLLLFMIALILISCGQKKKLAYYADTDNYITVTSTVSYAKLSEDASSLYLAFDDMSLQLSDNCFKVVGNNLKSLQKELGDNTLKVGDQIEFVTAPKYFGDGYVMPIVAMKRDGVELLSFDDGVRELIVWLRLEK